MVITNLVRANADKLEYLIQSFSEMAERNGAVMRVVALDQDMAVEAAHLRNREYADAAEGLRSHRKDVEI